MALPEQFDLLRAAVMPSDPIVLRFSQVYEGCADERPFNLFESVRAGKRIPS
jgi:hypothetical protein